MAIERKSEAVDWLIQGKTMLLAQSNGDEHENTKMVPRRKAKAREVS